MKDFVLNEKSRSKYSIYHLIEIHQRYLELAYAASDVGCELPTYSLQCQNYIDHGKGSVESIIDDLLEKEFFFQHTNYLNIIHAIKKDEDGDREKLSPKLIALNEWIGTFSSIEQARNHPALPSKLQAWIL